MVLSNERRRTGMESFFMKQQSFPHVRAAAKFAGSVLTGAIMFLVLAGVTVLVGLASDYMAVHVTDAYVSVGLQLVSRSMFTLDCVLLVYWTVYSFFQAIKPAKPRR